MAGPVVGYANEKGHRHGHPVHAKRVYSPQATSQQGEDMEVQALKEQGYGPRHSSFSISIHDLNYQRNGIGGEPFYSAVVSVRGKGDPQGAVVTFRTVQEDPQNGGHDDIRVDRSSVRVVDPKHPKDAWRGDEFGDALQDALDQKLHDEKVYEVDDKGRARRIRD